MFDNTSGIEDRERGGGARQHHHVRRGGVWQVLTIDRCKWKRNRLSSVQSLKL